MSRLNEYLEAARSDMDKLEAWENKKFGEYNKELEKGFDLADRVDDEITFIEKDFIKYVKEQIQEDKKNGVSLEDYKGSDNFEESVKQIIEVVIESCSSIDETIVRDEVEEFFYENYKNEIIELMKKGK